MAYKRISEIDFEASIEVSARSAFLVFSASETTAFWAVFLFAGLFQALEPGSL
jgi:hypothetical protein